MILLSSNLSAPACGRHVIFQQENEEGAKARLEITEAEVYGEPQEVVEDLLQQQQKPESFQNLLEF